MQQTQFLVNKNDLTDTRWHNSSAAALAPGEVQLQVDQFALTANNITYAVAGERMNYWDFFPTESGWGQVPVWGFANVVASAHPQIAIGERYYGYYPMATHLTVQPDRVRDQGFVDAVPYRQELAAVYNQYQKVSGSADSDEEAAQMLYRPLFMTSFILDDYLAEAEFFGAEAVLLTSASSKTSIGLATLLHRRNAVQVVGLTSAPNEAFVASLGCYDQVVGYQHIGQLDPSVPSDVVDMAGNGQTLATIHNHFNDALKQSTLVGATHWNARAGTREMSGPRPQLFFAPDHIAKRSKQWGPGGLEKHFALAWNGFTEAVKDWITVEHGSGHDAVEQTYALQLAGNASPDRGYVLSL